MPARNSQTSKSSVRGTAQVHSIQVDALPPSPVDDDDFSAAKSATSDSASDLFDSLFSSSSLPSHSLNDGSNCPEIQSSSPPPLIIRSADDEAVIKSNEAEKSARANLARMSTRSSSSAPSDQLKTEEPAIGQKRPSPTSLSSAPSNSASVYDFASQHQQKRVKVLEHEKQSSSTKFFGLNRNKVSYSHKWSDPSETDAGTKEEIEILSTSKTSVYDFSASNSVSGGYRAFRKVKRAHQCMESGELDDFKQELEYIVSTLLNEDASANLRYLSTIQLAKKCVSLEFRRFLKSENVLEKIFQSFADSSNSPGLSLAIAAVVYFMARDQKNLTVNDTSLRLISVLLKQEHKSPDAELKKQTHEVWTIIKEWISNCAEKTSRNIQFDLTEETLSTSFLMLEALAYISVREHDQFFKQELLNSGCLQWIVAKFDKAVLTISYCASTESEARVMLVLKEIERCYRILENAAAFNKKNQAYLINHRVGLLLVGSAKFLNFFHQFFEAAAQSTASNSSGNQQNGKHVGSYDNAISVQLFDCICLLSRVLMNVSHENELCCLKLGQIPGFLNNCISTLTNIAPQYASKEKFFDICVMMYGLLVNMVERCTANRKKVLELTAPLYDSDSKDNREFPVLEALTKLFVRHDTAARTIDEELDNDLVFEEPIEGDEEASNHEPATQQNSGDNGRLQRQVELTEDEILNTVQSAMNKASAHMEDSMIASYLALLIGCLVETDEKLAEEVKSKLPDKSLEVMIDQLQRFLDFMKLTNLKSAATKSIERIIKSMQVAAGVIH